MKTIKRVLMCRPTYFTVEYIINPWMKPDTVDTANAMLQWQELVHVYEKLGIKVETIDQQRYLPDMVFAADQGIVTRRNVLVSNFRHNERKGERFPYMLWFEKNDYSLQFISEGYYFEGTGESLWMGNKLFIGTGFRTNEDGARRIGEALNVETHPLELVDPRFYHLDTCFFPLNAETAFYYPPGFKNSSIDILKKNIPNLIEFTDAEVLGFAANSISSGNTAIMQKGNPTFVKKVQDLGYKVIELDVSEFIKAGGGIHCLTNVLEEVWK